MYANEYNRNIKDTVLRLAQNHINHEKNIFENSGPIGGCCGCDCNCKKCMLIQGSGMSGGLRTDHDLGFEPLEYQYGFGMSAGGMSGGLSLETKKAVIKAVGELKKKKPRGGAMNKADQNKFIEKLNKKGKGMSAGAKRGRPKKQTQKDKEDEKMAMEIKELKDVAKKGKKTGKGIISGLLDTLGLGRKKTGKGLTLGETPQQQVNIIQSQGGAKKEKVIENIIEKVSGKGYSAGVKEYKKKVGGGNPNPRKIGGRKLLLKQEQPPSMMSGMGQSGGKKKVGGAWSELLKKVKLENPHLKGLKEVINFIKENNLYKK